MESTKDIYKTGALLSAKRIYEPERQEYITKKMQVIEEHIEEQVRKKYENQNEQVIKKLLEKEADIARTNLELELPSIDVTNLSKIKTLDELINEGIEKDRQEVIEIGEALKELIQNAPKEDTVELETKSQTVEEFANDSIQDNDEKDDFGKILESVENEETTQESKETTQEYEFIEPKYFIIEIGDEQNSKQIVVDIEGQPVGKIENGNLEINEEYINSKLEEYNIDDYISSKIPNREEQQRIKQELKPKTLEQLSEIDFNSGKDIFKKVD